MASVDPIIAALTEQQVWYVCLRKCTVMGHDLVRGEVLNIGALRRDRLDTLVSRRLLFMYPYGLKPPEENAEGPPDAP